MRVARITPRSRSRSRQQSCTRPRLLAATPPPPVALSPALVTAFTGRLVADALNPALRLVAAAEYTSLQPPTLPFESVFTTPNSSAWRFQYSRQPTATKP